MSDLSIKTFELHDFEPDQVQDFRDLFEAAYTNSNMYRDFQNDIQTQPEIFRLFAAVHHDKPVGAVIVETKPHSGINYFGPPPIHIKRFTVSPNYRGEGIGKRLLDAGLTYAFTLPELDVVFGESSEAGALSFYGRNGAFYSWNAIANYSDRNTPAQNVEFFKELITNPKFRSYRFPKGSGFPFVFCRNVGITKAFEARSFISWADLLKGQAPRTINVRQQH